MNNERSCILRVRSSASPPSSPCLRSWNKNWLSQRICAFPIPRTHRVVLLNREFDFRKILYRV